MEMHDRIKEARETAQLTKSQLARALGLSRASVSAWETGAVKNLKNEHLFKLSKITGFSARWLATGQGPKERESASSTVAYLPNSGHITDEPVTKSDKNELEFTGHMDAWDSDTPLDPDEVELPLFREVEVAAGGGRTEVVENH